MNYVHEFIAFAATCAYLLEAKGLSLISNLIFVRSLQLIVSMSTKHAVNT